MRSCPTSVVVFPVAARRLHGSVAARSPPAQLADAVPAVHVQGASAVAVTQARASLCKASSHTVKHTGKAKQRSLERGSLNGFYFFVAFLCLQFISPLSLGVFPPGENCPILASEQW